MNADGRLGDRSSAQGADGADKSFNMTMDKSSAPSAVSRLSLCFCVSVVCTVSILGCSKSPESAKPQAAPGSGAFVVGDPNLIALNNRGVGLMGKFEYDEALKVFDQLAQQHPQWIEVQVNRAIATLNRQREGDEEAALKILDDVLQTDANNLRAHYCSGLLKLYLQSPAEALKHFQIVAEVDPQDAYAAYYTGQCLAQERTYDEALTWYGRAVAIDPYLRSAYYAVSQAARAAGRNNEAAEFLDAFQKLEKNPRARLVEFKYTRMGPKGMALAVDVEKREPTPLPVGPVFLDPVPLLTNGDQYIWRAPREDRPVSITACDIDMESDIDVFIAGAVDDVRIHNAVCINNGDGTFTMDPAHPLASVENVNAALWGDYDNDGLTDVYLCRRGANMLWRQAEKGVWKDVTESTKAANGELDTVDGAMVDFDHDGDLDIFCVNFDGPNELLNNNLDGTFRPIAKEQGIAGPGTGSVQVLPVDLDADRDMDIIVLNKQPPHDVWVNDRLWKYRTAEGFDEFRQSSAQAALAIGSEHDGNADLWTLRWSLMRQWWNRQGAQYVTASFDHSQESPDARENSFFMLACATGDGKASSVSRTARGWSANSLSRADIDTDFYSDVVARGMAELILGGENGPALVGIPEADQPLIWRPGPGRYPFATLSFFGRKDADTMRSNASGIGTHYAARIDSMWVMGDRLRDSSGPGQSLQPVAIGLGGHDKIDFVAIDWSDGVFQSEIDLAAGKEHEIVETQRQLSSCPVLFAWNGEEYAFVTDVLGVGGIGYMVTPGEYAPSRPWENVLLPDGASESQNGRYVLKLSEPMEEACYLDSAKLVAYDLPPRWHMTVDDRMSILGPDPTGELIVFRETISTMNVMNDRGEDVTKDVVAADLRAAPVGEVDPRFIGRLVKDCSLTITFDQPLDRDAPSRKRLMMIIDGWVEYPYSQTMFAAWQAGADYRAPSIEAMDGHGQWHMVLEQFGYPAGMPRQMSVPLPPERLPKGCNTLRITTNQEIYFDRIAIALAESNDQVVRHELPMTEARLIQSGFAKRQTFDQRRPYYNYNQRAPFWDTRYQRGLYTCVGPCLELVQAHDEALAIFGPGEEIHMEFDASMPALPAGWTRAFMLEVRGWCKDMDLFTKDGETLEPLPGESSSHRNRLHEKYNSRYESGRSTPQ
jgi:tetratricopeptide (TPR) repeat protein